jgi:DNA-binding response OmpR family regulator
MVYGSGVEDLTLQNGEMQFLNMLWQYLGSKVATGDLAEQMYGEASEANNFRIQRNVSTVRDKLSSTGFIIVTSRAGQTEKTSYSLQSK